MAAHLLLFNARLLDSHDQSTQIDAQSLLHGGLFDFDLEVEPVLGVLMSKAVEQGLMEVLEEEETKEVEVFPVAIKGSIVSLTCSFAALQESVRSATQLGAC